MRLISPSGKFGERGFRIELGEIEATLTQHEAIQEAVVVVHDKGNNPWEVIYHNGALVNHLYPYSVLKAPNVLGIQEILRLATQAKLKPVHYISTLGVLDSTQLGNVQPLNEQTTLENGNYLEGGL